ncbi:MAG: cytochrome o ubiquinol oxidase subunit III [Candidatus Doudnabacteria bacterium]|nr:cytochrome o ubiquinol oxidase subunit III [Candidatus Doudnabacteria bacterium]
MNENHHYENSLFGFWIYLMTDLLTFAVLFAAFAVLRNNTFGGPTGRELFDLKFVLTETVILLVSSFTCGLAVVGMHRGNKNLVLAWFAVTFALGITFLVMEGREFSHLISEGNSWRRSASLSSFFTLVGTHGLHISIGLLWMLISMITVWFRGLTPFVQSKLTRLSLFWHFLDIVWIFIFTIVYLMGVI